MCSVLAVDCKAIVFPGIVELVTLEVPLIEIEVTAVLQSEVGSAGKDQRKIGVAVTVSVGHSAAKE